MKLGKFRVAGNLWVVIQFFEKPLAALLDLTGQLAFTRFRNIAEFDADPVHERFAVRLEGRAKAAVALRKLHHRQRRMHVLCGFDTDVIAVKRGPNRTTQPVNAGQRDYAQEQRDGQHQQRAIANPAT